MSPTGRSASGDSAPKTIRKLIAPKHLVDGSNKIEQERKQPLPKDFDHGHLGSHSGEDADGAGVESDGEKEGHDEGISRHASHGVSRLPGYPERALLEFSGVIVIVNDAPDQSGVDNSIRLNADGHTRFFSKLKNSVCLIRRLPFSQMAHQSARSVFFCFGKFSREQLP
ncbi:hypothetical protein DFH08DRAFT_827981 [Mycena albidolilacea]|uniref:Uncharacterized protein n=1 Tax=Mycena albidolilacea TaxID=1033008 RepID=A0AAD7E6J6_9AGAR|nr:hypothetical protein DFH08DRAFT_827981 [Mycena albidolilacea]